MSSVFMANAHHMAVVVIAAGKENTVLTIVSNREKYVKENIVLFIVSNCNACWQGKYCSICRK